MSIKIDDKSLMLGLGKINGMIEGTSDDALHAMADTLLVLSRHEVPHDEGVLQNSGHVFVDSEGVGVAYNTEYAAYQHEGRRGDGTRKIRNYQKGRKSKYLEDPLKHNISKWEEIARTTLSKKLKGNI